jgi:SAM-dependent methyltransferase
MPDLSWNKRLWGKTYDWEAGGEEWSTAWGGSEAQWFGCIYPRIHRFLPADRVLEIAPGFGRWTKFLLPATKTNYWGIDLSKACVSRCRDLFRSEVRASFYTNDGLSLDSAPDGMLDFVFSFDSLVHAEIDVLGAYVPQILRKLNPNGVAFIHHSNWLDAGEHGDNIHNRAVSVSAERVATLVRGSGGIVLIQEIVNWGADSCIDCFSVFSRTERHSSTPTDLIRNPRFMDEVSIICQVQSAYSRIQ